MSTLQGCSRQRQDRADSSLPQLASAAAIDTDSVATLRSAEADSVLQHLYQWALNFGDSRADVRKHLGAPSAVTVSSSDNPYTPTTDTVTFMTYPHFECVIVRAGSDGRELLTNLSITATPTPFPFDVRFNATTDTQVLHLLGAPKNTQAFGDTTVMSFRPPNDETGEVIQFYFLAAVLRKMRWVFYVD